MLRPEIAELSMSGSSFQVAMNALLLKRLRPPDRRPTHEPPGPDTSVTPVTVTAGHPRPTEE
jgi:Cu2+-exporting ATPase